MGIPTIFEGGLPLRDGWLDQVTRLNTRLKGALSEGQLGTLMQRRQFLESTIGPIRKLRSLCREELQSVLAHGPLVGVDGSINTFGGGFPHYVSFVRAMAKPTLGDPITLQEIYCPLGLSTKTVVSDDEARQAVLAELEIKAAMAAVGSLRPALLLMDGPLVRFDMRARESFNLLRQSILGTGTIMLGCIENIESRVIPALLGEDAPPAWRDRYDRELLWGVLEEGELLEVRRPSKGIDPSNPEDDTRAIRTWFARASMAQGVVGVDILEEQIDRAAKVVDYIFTLSPKDGRGIPIWMDVVDREVRLTSSELEAYLELLDPELKRFFVAKRSQRFF